MFRAIFEDGIVLVSIALIVACVVNMHEITKHIVVW